MLGRAFDVFLRANFESKGGLGIYLTPAPVKQAMLALAFHDIKESTEDAARLVARDGKGRPAFRFCDPACGSGGFLSVALSHLRRTLDEIGGKATATDEARKKLFAEMCEHSFVGADSSPQMVMLARVNMALLGAPKARIFYTQNSLTSAQLKPGAFDLICTNPPFGTPKFNKGQEEAKKAHEEAMEEILETFRSDLTPRDGRAGGLRLFADGRRASPWAARRTARASGRRHRPTPTRRCCSSTAACNCCKPGGRLLIVLPDGVLCNSGDRYVREYIMGTKDEATGEFHGGKAIVKGGHQPTRGRFQALGHWRQDQRTLRAEAPRAQGRPGEVPGRAANRRVHGRRRDARLRGEEQCRGLQRGRPQRPGRHRRRVRAGE